MIFRLGEFWNSESFLIYVVKYDMIKENNIALMQGLWGKIENENRKRKNACRGTV